MENYIEGDIIAGDDCILLRKQREIDRYFYRKLFKENFPIRNDELLADFDNFFEVVWEEMKKEDALHISIISKEECAYLGNIVLKHLESTTPEIGIDILKGYQRKGIAARAIGLFKEAVKRKRDIDFFVVRIHEDNEASIRLFDKLGAVEIEREPGELQAMKEFLQNKTGLTKVDAENQILAEFAPADENSIIRYKLF